MVESEGANRLAVLLQDNKQFCHPEVCETAVDTGDPVR
jgi:hypothetical protein